MYRPPKKKKGHPGTPGNPADQRKIPANAQGDDRNLVSIDEAFKEAEFEDKVWLFWARNKAAIIAGAVAALLAVVAVQGYRIYQEKKLAQLQDSYIQASQSGALESFGQQHADTTLGGLALLESADKQYAEENYTAAAKLYQEAILPLNNTPFAQRARLGLGMSQLKAGQKNEAINTLKALADDSQAIGALRGEAAYNIAIFSVSEKDFATAQTWIDRISKIPNASFWGERARLLVEAVPELQKAKATP